jgi:hypothetical protein
MKQGYKIDSFNQLPLTTPSADTPNVMLPTSPLLCLQPELRNQIYALGFGGYELAIVYPRLGVEAIPAGGCICYATASIFGKLIAPIYTCR